MSTSPQAPPDFTVNGYRLITRIGEGGMGVVHLAQRPGQPRVALKVIRPNIVGDDEARERLAREVGSLERIRSPRIAEIVDADPWGDIPYVATRYVPGLSLHEHVREEGAITGADLTWFAAGLAEALAAVHACGVLHRDVKPSNVLLEGRNPVLIDFGLARVADDPRLTHTGWLLGTPGYLAPEILMGEDASTASDVHSWAATVAFAGLGRPPFGRGPGMAIMDRVRRGEHDLAGLPPYLRSLLADCLEPDPSERPTLAEILAELRPDHVVVEVDSDDDPFTMPLAVAALAGARDVTTAAPPEPVPVPTPVGGTWVLPPEGDTRVEYDDWEGWGEPVELGPDPVGPGERVRRTSLALLLALVVTTAMAAAPWLALAGVAIAAWLLRSASYAGSAAAGRRLVRGRRWYDPAIVLMSSPWHLVRALPSTLLLVLWAGCLALAGGLLGYAVSTRAEAVLAGCGILLAIGTWSGPGGSRVRGPVRRITEPLSRSVGPWFVAAAVLAALAAGLAGAALERGTSWTPFQESPLSGVGADQVPGIP